MPGRETWSEDEYVLALDLYLRRGIVPRDDPELVELARLTGRTQDSVRMRLSNFRHSDPSTELRGLDGGGEAVQSVWDKFADDRERLQMAVADAIPRLEQLRAENEHVQSAEHEVRDQSARDGRFGWVPLYEQIANGLLAFRNRRADLLKGIEELSGRSAGLSYLKDQYEDGTIGPLKDICPFTVMGVFNRGITHASRIKLAAELAGLLGVEAEAPRTFDGIPVLNNQKSMFFWWEIHRGAGDIDLLWELFESALRYADSDSFQDRQQFANAFDEAMSVKGVGWNLTMGLFWIRPLFFLTLDGNSREYLENVLNVRVGRTGPKGYCSASDYLSLMDDLRTRFMDEDFPVRSFPELSLTSWEYTGSRSETGAGNSEQRRAAARNAFLLSWNPTYWAWDDLADDARAIQSGRPTESGTGKDRWSVRNRDVCRGDRLFLIRVGKAPKGIVGSGVATSDVFSAAHWSQEPGKSAQYVRVKWDALLAPGQPPLPIEVLESEIDPHFRWTPQSSSVRLPPDTWGRLEERWAQHIGDASPVAPTLIQDSDMDYSVPFTDVDVVQDLFFDHKLVLSWLELLKTKQNLILQGPPGVGKTLIARRLAYGLIGTRADDQVEWLQFHQSYSYEDFVQGWRPSKSGFELQPGRFLQFCRRAASAPSRDFVLVIDEINRGNLSRIFGEVLSLLETDKRGSGHAVTLSYQSHELAQRDMTTPFFVPENLFVIGMMNTADRSLAMVDYALRRRFSFVSLAPQFESPHFRVFLESRGVPRGLVDHIVRTMSEINKDICEDRRHLGEGFQIGHSFFCPPVGVTGDFTSWFAAVVEHEILPLLGEYWIDADEKVAECRDVLKYVDSDR